MIYIPNNLLKDIDTILFKYLWDGKPPKIKISTIIASIEEGGLNMLDIFAVHTTAKCGWVRRLNSEKHKGKWKSTMYTMLNIKGEQTYYTKIFSQ